MPAKLKPRRFEISSNCKRICSLNAANLPGRSADLIHGWYEAGDNNAKIVERATLINVKISEGSVGRHRANHLIPVDQLEDPTDSPDEKVNELELLDAIISRGAKDLRLKTAKVTADQALKAIDLKYKLTQGNVLDDFLSAIGATMDDAGLPGGENPAAQGASDEQPDPEPE